MLILNRPKKPFHPGSLNYLAEVLGKDARTIRRYCVAGIVPGSCAVKLNSGHWRINYRRFTRSAYRRMLVEIRLHTRNRNAPRVQITRRRNVVGKLSKDAAIAHALALANREDGYLFPDEVESREQRTKHGIADDPIPEQMLKAVSGSLATKTQLLIAVRQLYMEQIPLSTKKGIGRIAERLGISRATLYRRYDVAQIKAAIRAAYPSSAGSHRTVSFPRSSPG